MKASNKILHEKQYAERILKITGDTMFFVYKDGTCLDFKPNRPDFYIKEEEVIGKNIFSYFPLETAREMHKEFKKVIDGKVSSSAQNYKLILGEEVKYYKCIISKFNEDHLIFQYRDITGRSVVRLKLEKKIKDLREVEKAAHIGLWTFDSLTRIFTYSGYTQVFSDNEEEKTITLDEYIAYIHPEDKTRVENWVENYLHGKESSDTISYKLLMNGKTVDMRLKIYNREVYTNRILLEGYIQNTSEIVWKAERSNQLKSAFLANMSHEIRTPLNAILGFSRIIAETDNSEERLQYYDIVEKNNMRLQELINEILDLSKIEAGTLEYIKRPMNLGEVCRTIYAVHKERVKEGVTLVFDNEDENLFIEGDQNRIMQVITNFLTNASKFTYAGEIRLGFERTDKNIRVYVKDTGIGIEPEKVDHVFERFVKLNSFAQGTGLGLSICQMIIEKIGGEIGVTSELGKGSTFYFTIPYEEAGELGEIFKMSKTESKGNTVNRVQQIKKILVAEDVESNFILLKNLIGREYTLLWAKDGVEAIEMYKQYQPDLILMDIKMPRMDGLEATHIIRSYSKEVPIIALTAYAFETDKELALEMGCNDFVTKPVSERTLRKALDKYSTIV